MPRLKLFPFLLFPIAATFAFVPIHSHTKAWSKTALMAEGGPPQYKKRPATIISNEEVGRGSYLIHVKAEDGDPVDYQPGHVLALEIQDPDGEEEEGWMRGPYTVTRSDENSFQVLYRVVGKKTETFRSAPVGGSVRFGGKFKVPIFEGISLDGSVERVVGLSTGVGIGPLLGFAEQALKEQGSGAQQYRIDLYGAFRSEEDVCCSRDLDMLASEFPDRFSWTPVVSSERGRVSDEENLSLIAAGGPSACSSPGSTHYHMVGNGSMVNEFVAGLKEAGVPDDRVTLEMYFNHKVEARQEAVKAIGEGMREASTAPLK